ncbi:glycosylphosphatidylinositol anchor attachment 1 [Echinococcus multilocularis]|uniref:Glycosylphosphatidylinositol anchor attachment 1 n=1 Tax=Echinococcus multilocularis TaxID=6211 RepID=A0A087W019_ECHMU|nr:glycosylphosphatidylinositol anchor attachment 1 [Echinococcus multilocularis]
MLHLIVDRCVKFSKSLSLLFYLVGIIGLLTLSQPEFNYETYVSENALLIGLVDETYDPEQNISNIMKEFIDAAADKTKTASIIRREMEKFGLEVYEQKFIFSHKLLRSVGNVSSSNLYAIMRSRGGSRTEALVVIAPLRAIGESEEIIPGTYTYLISLAKRLSTQLYWAKDIIFLFPDMEYIGLMAWLDAYHGVNTSPIVHGAKLRGRSGSLQAGIALKFPSLSMARLDVSFQGINGELPNLDLINTVARLAKKHSIPLSLHGQLQGFIYSSPLPTLKQLISSIWIQSSGSPSGLHGPLINFQVPCLTLRGISSPSSTQQLNTNYIRQIGSLVEGFLRCLNNLQERMHQSFYYYLLPDLWHYISIGVYSPFFFLALGGLLLQVIRIYVKFTSKEKQSSKILTAKHVFEKFDFTSSTVDTTDPDIEIRQRHATTAKTKASKNGTKTDHEVKEDKEGGERNEFNIAILLPAASSLGLCMAGGVAIHVFPDVLYAYLLDFSADDPDGVWQLTEVSFAAVFLSAVVGFALLLPLIAVVSGSRWLGYGQDWRLTCALSGLLWACFLGCLSPLNISAAFLLLVAVEPVLLFVVCRSQPAPLHRILGIILLFMVSPPALVIAATLAHPLVLQYPPPGALGVITTFSDLQQQCGKVLFQAHMEATVLGSWSWSLLTLGVTPLWLFVWTGLLLSRM